MKLYMFEHCYLCFRVRMTAALARKHLEEVVVLEDDTDTMVALVRRRVVPILVRDDGQPMLESIDIARYIDHLGEPVLTGPERPAWVDEIAAADVDPVVWDMAWQANPDVASSNVLNVIGLGGEVLAEVLAIDRADPAAGFRLVARPPGAIW